MPTAPPPVEISLWQLAIASLLIFVSMLLSWRLQLGLSRDMLWGAARTFLQLSVTGYILKYIIDRSQEGAWYLTVLALGVMVGVAIWTANSRTTEPLPGKLGVHALSIAIGGLSVLAFVILGVLQLWPDWYNARYVLPLAGMIIGNAMTAGTLAVSRFASDVHKGRAEVEAALALGATPDQAVERIRRDAVRAALMPSVNSMLVVGIVSLPGMMTGQIIAGQDPTGAVRYQVMVMYMITAACAITAVIGVLAAARRAFTGAMQLRQTSER